MTTRRGFLASLAAIAAAVGLPAIPARTKYWTCERVFDVSGLDDGHPDHLSATDPNHGVSKVFIDGKDITSECFECHRSEGWAKCFVRGDDGGFIIDGDDWKMVENRGGKLHDISKPLTVRKVTLYGKIEVEWLSC